ncbi:UNVERIFIED_CONTAM: hypothetical protein Slati_4216800 [Sesamum latifolium]|uniref:Uncharacterized protein n=1 Tax=Sesamum latifolium TaxID=2727402 RepID=A0AAW2TBP7_9LAMI
MIAEGPTYGDSGRAICAHARAARTIMEIDDKVSVGTPAIQFGPTDTQGIHLPHNDVLVISATIANYTVQRIFVDSGSFVDILFLKVYQQMELGDVPLEPEDMSLYGFAGEVVHPLGQISLPISLGFEPTRKTRIVRFLVVDMPSAYNLILGRPTLNAFQAVISTYQGEVQGDQYTARRCYVEAIKSSTSRMEVDTPSQGDRGDLSPQEEQQSIIPARVQPAEEVMSIQLVPGEPDNTTKKGSQLIPTLAGQLTTFLQQNVDIFAWTTNDLTGIDPSEIVHTLNVDPTYPPVK